MGGADASVGSRVARPHFAVATTGLRLRPSPLQFVEMFVAVQRPLEQPSSAARLRLYDYVIRKARNGRVHALSGAENGPRCFWESHRAHERRNSGVDRIHKLRPQRSERSYVSMHAHGPPRGIELVPEGKVCERRRNIRRAVATLVRVD